MDYDPVVPPDPPDPEGNYTLINKGKKRPSENPEQSSAAKKVITSIEMASASIQNVYVDPAVVIGLQSYSEIDKGPYLVHVSRTEPDPSAGTTIRPIKFGQFLKNHKFSNICPGGVKQVGRNKISVQFNSANDANTFITSDILSMCKYSASIPTYNVTRMGLVRSIPTDMSLDEFASSIDLPPGCGKILKARRLNRKTIDDGKITWVPTQTIVVTFKGQLLPSKIFSYYTALTVELYQFPTIQCFTCCRYGHTKTQCRSKPKCFRCSQEHSGDSCEVTEANAKCLHCSGKHFATNRNCPEQERQKSIKSVMAQNSVSYEEAASQFPKSSPSYAEMTHEKVTTSNPIHQSQSYPSASPSQPTRSYVKAVYANPRPRAPLGKSFDKTAHREMVSDPSSSLPNGCALGSTPSLLQNENMIETLLTLIINIISMNPHSIPSNVASKLTQLVSLSGQYGSSGRSAMELPEQQSQKT